MPEKKSILGRQPISIAGGMKVPMRLSTKERGESLKVRGAGKGRRTIGLSIHDRLKESIRPKDEMDEGRKNTLQKTDKR